ncbi:hypothetical protein [Alicyclobacillus mengziensis]|uniref:Uncharacterized protein n=1 Tax=Alicyclobacillus mengziensis TaxID=2931921 RepID=A0A9X7Z771_9BACL|nr:hypothetical protein [Alicyclobacillus mengziensis]QSO48769.1 hypothetical protein JZ786_07370 [Alicyclobacillus mengziensis]
MLQLAEKASDVRQHFSEFVDTVVRDRPGFVTRNRDILAALNLEHLAVLVEPLQFHANLESDENQEYVGTVDEVEDIVVGGATKDEAMTAIAQMLIEYAEDYLTDSFRLYFNAPNRRKHFPYVLKVAMLDTVDDVKRLIHA